jgi:hypothetical protein
MLGFYLAIHFLLEAMVLLFFINMVVKILFLVVILHYLMLNFFYEDATFFKKCSLFLGMFERINKMRVLS